MSSKLCYFLIVLIAMPTWHVKGRIVGGKGDDSSIESGSHEPNEQSLTHTSASRKSDNVSPIKELTDEEIQQMKKQLSKELTPKQIDEFGQILNKFKKGTTTKDHVEGIVELLVFAVAVKSNATDIDIAKIFHDDSETTTTHGSVTLNNI